MKNNLLELVKKGEIEKTGAKPKLPTTVHGIAESVLDVYRIPLKYLYFNNENGRIASQMRRNNELLEPVTDEINPNYNNLFAKLINEDNHNKLVQTKKSIQKNGQQVYGYVLQDGRIIDGNRRFTALRQIQQETGETHYFEAVILPFSYNEKIYREKIKKLELAIQMGVEERVPYDPVDLAVDIFQTVVIDKLMTETDYARESNLEVSTVRLAIETIYLIQDFLQFINAQSEAYFIVKDVKLYNAISELAKYYKKTYPDKGPVYEQNKLTAFTLLCKNLQTGGDIVRIMRDYQNDIAKTKVNNEFNNEIEDTINDFRDKLEEEPIEDVIEFRKVLNKSNPEFRKINDTYNKIVNRENRGKNVENFLNDIEKSVTLLEDLKKYNGLSGKLKYSDFSSEQLEKLTKMMISLHITSQDLIEVYQDEQQS